ncbi:hypothetical protein [Chryseobacterium flavum]|uniref:hypothetical protein n=1 Tax=Chryseobacterium flavum TaxID=415851 RepID=UPI002FD989C6
MISINKMQVENLINSLESEINSQHDKAILNLRNLYNNNKYLTSKESSFLRLIIREFRKKNFVSFPLQDMDDLVYRIGEMPITQKRRFSGKKKESYLKDEILKALNYSGNRSLFYPQYFQRLGIKSCVYCNSQLTVTIQKSLEEKGIISTEYKANFQVDHYYPKDKYPYLSIALFNLYPVCASCNLTKLNNIIDFKLYDTKVNTNIFHFELDKSSKAKFLITRNIEDLKIIFKRTGDDSYKDIFNVTEIYQTQTDIAEEIILKALAYSPVHRDYLKNIYKSNRINDTLIDRIILGNYTKAEEILKRPMAKFMQDIGKEVGLI